MDRKKALKQMFKETPVEAVVYQIKNLVNNKMFIGSTRNVKTLNGVKFQLETGTHSNKKLQEEWKHYGQDTFTVEVLETLKKNDDPYYNEKEALADLEIKWLNQLQPYEERGYNKQKP
ncbi:GIY-YIG nuclease family protein [Niallia endozanthoxylica]|uniref:GIY-YIG nuclease family protein n=1 Tax=Niallia endozanthoxylica TaxID=2036016 RepID=A0A5J5HQI0_9BACI|nr:GIY-YIG nuclease family protein [Niallia endozanthoxylica]KAA9021769.1 GIY-YIG nuclease family protein [Niallia endozanthoxylica]